MHPGTTNSGKQVKTALFESYYAKHDKDVGLSKIEACYVSIKKIRLGCTATSERSALVNIRRKALSSSVGFRKRMTSRSSRDIYFMYASASIVHSDLSDDLRFVARSCLAFSVIPRLIHTRRCHCLRLKDVLKFQVSSFSAG